MSRRWSKFKYKQFKYFKNVAYIAKKKNPGQQIIYLCKAKFCWAVYEGVINKAYREGMKDKLCSQKCLSSFGLFLKIFILLANTEHLLIKLLLELFSCAWNLDASVSCLLQVINL